MKALITGASNGIGKEMAIYLSELGYDIIIVARSLDKLLELKNELKTKVTVFEYDLSVLDNCYKLYEELKDEQIDVVINSVHICIARKIYQNFPVNQSLTSCLNISPTFFPCLSANITITENTRNRFRGCSAEILYFHIFHPLKIIFLHYTTWVQICLRQK